MDGTLLGTDSRLSDFSAETISELTDRGALITVATARTTATVVPLLAAARTTPPAVVMTGAALWDRTTSKFIEAHFISGKDVQRTVEVCRLYGISPYVYVMSTDGTTMDVYHEAPILNKTENNFYEERCRLPLKRFHIGTPAPERALTHTMLLYAMGSAEAIKAAAADFARASNCAVQCYPDIFNKEIYNLEIFPPGISKASAILKLKKDLGADRLVVFGDNLNDLSMLHVADVAVAVENALNEVKSAADVVIGPNYTNSVASFIAEDFNNKTP